MLSIHRREADERMQAELREHGMDAGSVPPAGEEYEPDDAWQRALSEKRRLLAAQPRSN